MDNPLETQRNTKVSQKKLFQKHEDFQSEKIVIGF